MALEGLFGEQEPDLSGFKPEPTEEDQANNMSGFDLPVPGQSLTSGPGQASYEQPPQFTDLQEAADHMFDKVTEQSSVDSILRILSSGFPVPALVEPMVLHGVGEGLWNMDMAMMLIEPLTAMLIGLANMGNVPIDKDYGKESKAIDTAPLEKVMKGTKIGAQRAKAALDDVQARKDKLLASAKPQPSGLLAKRSV